MRHNQQVAHNIRQIREQVEAANSQDDLVSVIENVGRHPGPLDYNDRASYGLAAILLTTILYVIYNVAFGHMNFNPNIQWVNVLFSYIIGYSSYWVPALFCLYLVLWLDNNNKKYFLDTYIEQPTLRFAIAAIVPALLLHPIHAWHYLYWNLLETIGYAVGTYFAPEQVGYAILATIVLVILWLYLRVRSNWREPISSRIFLLDTLFNNNLKDLKDQCSERYQQLSSRFADFKRGNDTRELVALFQGHHSGDVHNFDFQIYHFHYVVKTTSTTTDSDGNTRTTTTRKSYYRHGLVLPFPFAQSLTISSDSSIKGQGEKYSTASTVFNNAFSVRAGAEIDAARFLSPAVIEKISTLTSLVDKPVVELSFDNQLCLSFNDHDLITLNRAHSLSNPTEFAREISGHADLQKLDGLLDLIHDLMRLTDNNFAGNTTHTFNSQPIANAAEQTSN